MTNIETPAASRFDIIDQGDPRAVLNAWLGDYNMGSWPTDDEDAFKVALADELAYVGEGGSISGIIIEIA